MIGKLLGHTQVQTTARYAHLAADPVKEAAGRISAPLAASIFGHPQATEETNVAQDATFLDLGA